MRKRFLFIAGMLAICCAGNCQNLNEGFESLIFPPQGWTVYPSGDTTLANRDSYNGSACAGLYIENLEFNNVKRWLITPQLKVNNSSDSIVFDFASQYAPSDLDGVDSLFVLVSLTTNDTNAFVNTLFAGDVEDMNTYPYEHIGLSLANYVGQRIYIAFMVKDDEGFNWFYFDNIVGPQMVDYMLYNGITSLPYSEDFDSCSTNDSNAYPLGWRRLTTYCNSFLNTCCPYVTTSMADTTNYLFFMGDDTAYNVAILPKLSDSINLSDLHLTFDYKTRWLSMPFVVGVLSNPNDISTFVAIDSITATQELVWQNYDVSFSSYQGAGKYVALYMGSPYSQEMFPSCFVDNVVLSSNTICNSPEYITLVEADSNSLELSWKDSSFSGNYTLYYKEVDSDSWDSIICSDTVATLMNLQSSVIYNVFVVSNCSQDGVSLPSGIFSFATLCSDVTSFLNDTICEGNGFVFQGDTLTQSGEYTYSYQTEQGCDSTIVLRLTVHNIFNDTIKATIQQGETYSFNSREYSQSGIYVDSLFSQDGCDSVVVLNLEVLAGLNDLSHKSVLELLPNPAKEFIEIQTTNLVAESILEIIDIHGHVLIRQELSNNKSIIDISKLEDGVYFAKIYSGNGFKTIRFVKTH